MADSEKRGRGQPTKFTPEVCKRIIAGVGEGMTRHHAAESAGVSRTSFMMWLARGRREKEGEYADFLDLIKMAEAKAIRLLSRRVHVASKKTWQAAAWLLERRWPEDYSNQRAEIAMLKKEVAEIRKQGATRNTNGNQTSGTQREEEPPGTDEGGGPETVST